MSLRLHHDPFFGGLFDVVPRARAQHNTAVGLGALDLHETDKAYVFHADAPGLTKNDIKVNVKEGVLSISGERRNARDEEKEENGTKWHITERSFGSFTRSFHLPENADPSGIKAKCEHGVLQVTLPKLPKKEPESMDIVIE
jgi:HSP20 family protein